MPSSGKNPFDDDDDNSSRGKVAHNPFVNDDSEEGSRKTVPSCQKNPFDSDDECSELMAIPSEGGLLIPASPIKHDEDEGQSEPLSPKEQTDVLHLELDMIAHQRSYRDERFTTGSNQESFDSRSDELERWTPTANLPFDDCSQLSNEPLNSRSEELERASVGSDIQHDNSSQVLSGNNSFDNKSGCSLESGSHAQRNNGTKDSDRIDSSSTSNNKSISSVESEICDDADSVPDATAVGDEEAQVLHQTSCDNDEESVTDAISPQAGDEHRNKSDKEAMNDYNRDDENVRHNMPQSSLYIDEPGESSNPFSDETKEEGTTTPLFQTKQETYWDKEDIRDAVDSFDARCTREVDETKQDVENPLNLPVREPNVMRSSIRRKKVNHRYFKACVMVTFVWGAMIILVSVALGMDWWGVNNKLEQANSELLCTLCDGNRSYTSAYTLRPTRKPSSLTSPAFVGVATIKPPQENIAEVCAPSTFLHGPKKKPSLETLAASCVTACLPAACCIVNNDQARQALITMLESQGMGVQAATLFATIQDCNRGDNVAVCDSYNDFCSTLYDMEHALDTLPVYLQQACNKEAEDNSMSTAFSRQRVPKIMSETCKDACLPLACCYVEPIFATESLKRKRQHSVDYTLISRPNMETRQISGSGCDGFSAPTGSLNADLCNAYSPFCSSQGLDETVDLVPNPTSIPSYQSSNQPSYQPTQEIISPTTFVGSSEPSIIPSSKTGDSPSSHPTLTSYPSYVPSLAQSPENMTNAEPFMTNTTQPSLFTSLLSTTGNPSNASSQPSQFPTMSSYPTTNSSSIINTSNPSSIPSNASNIESEPSKHPTSSSLPTREGNKSHISS